MTRWIPSDQFSDGLFLLATAARGYRSEGQDGPADATTADGLKTLAARLRAGQMGDRADRLPVIAALADLAGSLVEPRS